jgi:transcriptional regulator with XRE-family HTH domain
MTIDVPAGRTLSDGAAEEIRVVMARRRMSGRQLAQRLGVSANWVSLRMSGAQTINLNDLDRIATVLEVQAVDLLPGRRGAGSSVTDTYRNVRPPAGRPRSYPAGSTHPPVVGGSRRPGSRSAPIAA